MDRSVAAGAEHGEVGDLCHPALFGLGQGNAVMGLNDFHAIDLERLDATCLAEERRVFESKTSEGG